MIMKCEVCLEEDIDVEPCDECETLMCSQCHIESYWGFYCGFKCALKDAVDIAKLYQEQIKELRNELNQKNAKST